MYVGVGVRADDCMGVDSSTVTNESISCMFDWKEHFRISVCGSARFTSEKLERHLSLFLTNILFLCAFLADFLLKSSSFRLKELSANAAFNLNGRFGFKQLQAPFNLCFDL